MKIFRVNISGPIWLRVDNEDKANYLVRDGLDEMFENMNVVETVYMDDDVMIDEVEEEDEEYS